ncbi:unnamed protein product [Clonostachys rosea f. rosea IK726]|uniref:Uncharacterized protein n=2 Tax=Bionectria ochroleuca TaxID=29856 RepID=A0A0B7K7G0_BIOOC|nr:unnamed protein product [Clonostachys rosea f. rosea IK726]
MQAAASHDVDPDVPIVNGTANYGDIENKHITNIEDSSAPTEASVSGGSDTEASRADGSRQGKDDEKGHNRAGSSIKKPATFKAVSVNKKFLASKVTTPGATAKAGDISRPSSSTPPPGASTPSSSKPRLIAKTAPGVGSRLSSLVNGGKPASAPDASAVWNKNRPVPVADPKKLTDEELKKYGIHVASRLEEDDIQGQSKWADLDDDDDDWAPEAITWTDGTKTTLPHPEEHPPPTHTVAENVPAPVPPKSLVPEKAPSPAPPPTTSSPLPKPSGLASGRGLKLKASPQEKPTLVAKPPAPLQPNKSPWATLPPVEKASPLVAEPGQRGQLKDSISHKGGPPSGLPPKEMAADDFSRPTWRDGSVHANRELFNSQSGRYEPVAERRGSQSKHPALLQRPVQGDQPAEPSSSFQTYRQSQDGHFGRRRASSNISGGSGSFYRMGKGNEAHMPGHEHLEVRRPSQAGSADSPVSPAAMPARYQTSQGSWGPQVSPRPNFAHLQQAGPTGPGAMPAQQPAQQGVDEIEYQKKLMRERNELARKRRMEQEAAEEAAKRERIQKKLEAMGPPPPKKSDKVEPQTGSDGPKPTQIQQREQSETSAGPIQPPTAKSEEATQVPGESSPAAAPLNTAVTPETASKRLPSDQEAKPDIWTGSRTRTDRFTPWAPGSQPQTRNVWGSPNNDRGLGNGTFDPELGRALNASGASAPIGKGPSPIAPPGPTSPSQSRSKQPPAPIGSRPSRFVQPVSDLASKWVASVAEGDKAINAARLADRAERDRKLAERGMTAEDVQPVIKETWRPVNVPGDGTRQAMSATDPNASHKGPWQAPGDVPPKEGSIASHAGVIGTTGNLVLPHPSPGTQSQLRSSRFFPAKDVRLEGQATAHSSRPQSPSPPPPTMDDHPAYEGNVMHPHVSLPKPQPIVKLPPSAQSNQGQQQPQRTNFAWATPAPFRDSTRAPPQSLPPTRRAGDVLERDWQKKFDNLFSDGKHQHHIPNHPQSHPPPHPPKSMVVDAASKSALDHVIQPDTATVSLPGRTHTSVMDVIRNAISKPMAEECFDEPEIGSLPQVRVPHKAPEAAWHPAESQTKPLPKRFLVHATGAEPLYFSAEVAGNGNAMHIYFPGMSECKTVILPFSATRGGRGGHGRGSRSRGGHRGNRRDNSSQDDRETSSNHSGRGGRSSYRGRRSDNWARSTPPHSSPKSSAQA